MNPIYFGGKFILKDLPVKEGEKLTLDCIGKPCKDYKVTSTNGGGSVITVPPTPGFVNDLIIFEKIVKRGLTLDKWEPKCR